MPFLALILFLICCGAPPSSVAESIPPCVDVSSEEMQGDVYVGMLEGGFLAPMQVKPGEKRTLKLWVRKGPAWKSPDVCVTWHLETPDLATLDEKTGALEVKANASHGVYIQVTGKLVGSTKEFTGVLAVYRPESNPLVGTWHEFAQQSCHDISWRRLLDSRDGIREFVVNPNGGFSVTWHPFESYIDYWGTYRFDLKKKTVEFVIKEGNYKPKDFVGKGTFLIKSDGTLQLKGVWFGSPRTGSNMSGFSDGKQRYCGHIFFKEQ